MTTTTLDAQHTPGPWSYDIDYIVAPDPEGIHPEIYIAEIAHRDSEGRIASPQRQEANRKLIAAAPALLAALKGLLAGFEQVPILILDLSFNFAVDVAKDVIDQAEGRE